MPARDETATSGEVCSNFVSQPDGRGGKIRTCGLTVPNRAHYQAVLRPVNFHAKRFQASDFTGEKCDGQAKSRKYRIIFAVARAR